jgi:hypothetical protein
MGIGERNEVSHRLKIDEQCRHAGPWAKEEMAEADPGGAAFPFCRPKRALMRSARPRNSLGQPIWRSTLWFSVIFIDFLLVFYGFSPGFF